MRESLVVVDVLAKAFGAVSHGVEAYGESIAKTLIEVDRSPVTAMRADAGAHPADVAPERGALRGRIHHAARGSDAEENRIGTSCLLNPLEIVAVDGHLPGEVIARRGRTQPTD